MEFAQTFGQSGPKAPGRYINTNPLQTYFRPNEFRHMLLNPPKILRLKPWESSSSGPHLQTIISRIGGVR
jgi:hypothetical protein